MLSKALKALAVFTFGMITFPFILTNDVLSFENISVFRILAYYCALGLIFGLGCAMGQIAQYGKHTRLLRFICRFTGIASFFLSLIMLFFNGGIMIIFALGVSAVFWFFLGERATEKNYADFFPMFAFGVYIAVTLICYLYYGALSPEELRQPIQSAVIISFMIQFSLTALLINQSGIYDKASRRRETKTMLPKGLSGYNAALVLVITLAGLGLYLFSDKIVWLLRQTVRLILTAILWLMRLGAEEMEVHVFDREGELLEPEAHSMQDDLTLVLAYIVVIVTVILLRKHIWRGIKNFFRMIYGFFVSRQGKSEELPEFVDVLEQAAPRKRARSEELSDSALKRRYRAESSPDKKYRLGYRILLRNLKRNKARIVPSDTAGQQCVKGRQVYGEQLSGIAECYNAVRYNGAQPTSAQLAELDGLIEEKL